MNTPQPPISYGVIPARYDSKRFNGKPLALILGKPMFWHVYQRAIQCPRLSRVVLATDDDRIFEKANELSVPVLMTRSDHKSGTDRVIEAARQLNLPDHAVVVNIQGDEPALEPNMLTELLTPFESEAAQVSTLARRISAEDSENPDQVKVVFTHDHQALYFSRAIIPYPRDDANAAAYFGHIGLYAFRMSTLIQFGSLQPSALERTEKLEQLRLLENGIPIHVVLTKHTSIGVDRPEDIERVVRILKQSSPM